MHIQNMCEIQKIDMFKNANSTSKFISKASV